MLKIFTEHNYLIDKNRGKFFPLFDELINNDKSKLHDNYCFVDSIEACDILVLPLFIDYLLENKEKKIVHFFKKSANDNNKPLWVFASGDFGLTMKEDYIYVFKMADFESKKSKKTIIMPAFIDDPYVKIYKSEISFLNKSDSPIIGYVGHAKGGLFKYLKFLINFLIYNFKVFTNKIHSDYFKPYSSSHKRLNYLKILLKATRLKTNFIFRDRYRAGAKSKEDRDKTTLEFFENIKSSHYTFCMRGFGNFSVRLYETLAMGRIPLQIDTDCSLPLSDFINWNDHCLIVKEEDIKNIELKVIEFNSKFSTIEFVNLQKSNRDFWEKYLTKENYFAFVHNLFIEGNI